MMTQIERTKSGSWMRVRSVVASILCIMGLPVILVLTLADIEPRVTAVVI